MERRQKLLIMIIAIIVSIYTMYQLFNTNKISYIALGDSLAEGRNPYGEIGYGYTDFIANYLKENNKLKSYTKKYTKSGYKVQDVMDELNNDLELKRDLREADFVTISIGANDFLAKINKNNLDINEISNYKNIVTDIIPNIDICIKEVRKYAKKDLVIVGYYNPIPFLFNTSQKDLDLLFSYIDDEYYKIAKKYNGIYVSNYQLFKNNKDYLPNPLDIHPDIEGYQAIANHVLDILNNKKSNNK